MELAELAAKVEQLSNELAQLKARIECPSCTGTGIIDTGGVGWAHGFPCSQCHGTGMRHTRTLGGPPTSPVLVPEAPT